jgi:hypothetical protein
MQRARETAIILDRTRLAIFDDTSNTSLAFSQNVTANPGRLSDLVIPITTAGLNSCGDNYTNSGANPRRDVPNWVTWGPFGGFTIDPNVGLPTPIGIGNNTLVRNPPTGGAGTLAIVFPNVDVEDVLVLDSIVDGSDGLAAGLIRWTAPSGGLTTLSYTITIDNNC